jgi:hypothetical protein
MNEMKLVSLVGLTALKVVRNLSGDGFFWLANYNRPIALVVKPEMTKEEFERMVERMREVIFPKL